MDKQKKVGRLQQMSDEMKQHIAQLKAELGNTEGERRNTTEMEKEVRNKVIASTLRKHLENTPRSKSMESCLSEEHFVPSDKVPLQRHDAAESLSRAIVDSTATKEYSLNPQETDPLTFSQPEPEQKANFVSTSEEHEKAMDTADQTDPDATGSGEMLTPNSKDLTVRATISCETTSRDPNNPPRVTGSLRSAADENLPFNDNTEQAPKARSRQLKKSRNGDSTSDTSSSSSPRSVIDGAEEGIPVKYLQMSTTASSPRTPKKKRASKLSQRSMSQDRILEMNPTPRSEASQLEDLESKLSDLQDQCELLAVENIKIKREQRSKAEEKIAMLKKRNGELANIARRLEEKARSLQEQNVKKTQDMASLTRDVQQLKRTHQRHKGRSEAEQTRALTEKDEQLAVITAQLEDLKKALRQSRRLKPVGDTEGYSESDIMRQTQKEMLQLQKLAAASSSKVIVRSLSTPVTARQKILEESNRNLRRQIATLEGSIQELEAKAGHSSEAEKRLKIVEDEKQQLNFEIDGHKNRILCLESELQKSKVEASDVSVQLTELKHVHVQVQNDYSTVHEQLAVAIKERDQAVARCIDHVTKAEEMETTIKSLYDEKRDFGALQIRHQEATETHDREVSRLSATHKDVVGEYERALQSLQAKVSRLEQQCEEQDLNNKNLQDQLSSLMQWSKQSGKSPIDTDNTNVNNNVAPGGTPLPPAPPTGSPQVHRFTTSGAASAFRKPTVTSQPGDNEARRGSASLASSGSRMAPDQDDTEAEDFDDDEVNMPLPGNHNPLPHPIPHHPHQHSPAVQVGDLPLTQQPQGPPVELRVFIAKYTYNPFEGPNEQPEAELPLVAGDYVYVHGEMDFDGFFEGELLSGERGLVPSNFLEPVHDVPHANGAIGVVGSIGSIGQHVIPSDNVIRPITQRPLSGEGSLRSASKNRSSDSNASRSICSTSSVDLESRDHSSEDDVENRSSVLPFPRKLRVDKTLSHSLIIGWIAPQLGDDDIVEEYHVIVDGCLATVVNGNKSKAVVERIYHDKNCYSISVCAVTDRGRSEPGHCTLRFGHSGGKSDVIGLVRVEHVTTGGARVSWDAVSSNRTCSLCVGEINDENRHLDTLTQYQRQILVTCPMFSQTIGGLKPNTTYEVLVKCKGRKSDPDALSKPIRFTTPTIGPPDPPLGVQVEENVSGSAESSLLVTWLPVTLKENGLSNGVPVSGYSVYINNIQVKTVEPGSSDQCHVTRTSLVDHVTRILASDQSYQPRSGANSGDDKLILPSVTFTVRTLASGGQLSDHSTPYHLHRSVVAKLAHLVAKQHAKHPRASPRAGPFVRGKKSNGMMSDVARGTHPPVVPSIEITMDTSSEDDLPVVKEADLYRNSSKSRRTKSVECRPHQEDPTSVFHSKMNGKSTRSTSNLHRNQNPHLASEEEDSEVSVYSEEHSSSTSESYKRFPREERLSSRGKQQVASGADLRTQGSLSRQRGEPTRKRSNSPRSLHSDDHHTDGSWHSNLSEVNHQTRSSSLARRLHHQHRRRLRNASSQSGGSTSEVDLVEDSRVFLFVALYDYDPYAMSPNTEMLDEELAFSEGQLIKVYGDKDADGFYFGENQNGKTGHVPCNLVSEVQVDDFTMLEELFERGRLPSASPDESKANGITSGDVPDPATRPPTADPGRMCVALFDYDPKESSPNIDAEVELSFRRGDLILIRGQMDEDGFFQGELNGQIGLVPSNFLDDVSDQGAHSFSSSSRAPAPPSTTSANTMTDASIPLTVPLQPDPSSSSFSKRLHEPPSLASTSSNTSSHASDSPKKKGILSKGKKFFKKFGANEGRPKK